MSFKFTNKHNIELPLALFLAHSDYDLISKKNQISATSILKPIKEIVLSICHPEIQKSVDLSDMAPSVMGSAMHMWLEKAVQSPETRAKAFAALDILSGEDSVVMSCEQRAEREIDGYTISGKYDLVVNGEVWDLKTMSVWGWILGSNKEKFIKQLSIYRWLNPDTITSDIGHIIYWFTDWSAKDARQKRDYPQQRCFTEEIALWSFEQVEAYLSEKLNSISVCANGTSQEEIPQCSSEELWQVPPKFAYYKKPGNKRATKLYNTFPEASARQIKEGCGEIQERPAQVKACIYCSALPVCNQAVQLQATGLLVL